MELPSDISSCHAIIKEQSKQIEQLLLLVSRLESRVQELEEQLSKDSHNSHKPPSSDGLRKRIAKSAMSKKRNLKRGGQKGHNGKTLDMVAMPDEVVRLLPTQCTCGHTLPDSVVEAGTLKETRQVFDLPEPKLRVTEYQQFACSCPKCHKQVSAAFPDSVPARVQYGSGVKSLAVLLNVGYHLPYQKIKGLFGDLFGYQINESTLWGANQLCHGLVEASEELIKEQLVTGQVAHLDETGIRTAGKLHWLHVCSSELFTYLFVHPKRGKKALNSDRSLLSQLNNFIIHDCWKSYFNYKQVRHGLCGAHLLRESLALQENGSLWAKWFSRYLLTLYQLVDKQKGVLTTHQQKKAIALFEQIWQNADRLEPTPMKAPNKRGRAKSTKGRNLLKRLKDHQEAVLAFAFNEQVPFTNNQAERDIRPFKTKLKVSNCFRTLKGAEVQARIFGFISTLRKHQVNIFKELQNTFTGNNFIISTYGAK